MATALGCPVTLALTRVATKVIDASDEGANNIFVAPKTGNISKIWTWFIDVLSPPTYRIGLEGATSPRSPDGTYKASGNAYVDLVPTTTAGWNTLGTAASVTAGDALARTVRYQSGTIGASNYATIIHAGTGPFGTFGGTPIPGTMTGGVWSFSDQQATCLAIQYDDGTVYGFALSAIADVSWSSSSNPRYRGTLYTPPMNVTINGIEAAIEIVNDSANFNLEIYTGTSGTPILTRSIDADVVYSTSSPGIARLYFPNIALTSGTKYYFVINPTTTNSVLSVLKTFADADAMAAINAQNCKSATTNSLTEPVSWTETANQFYGIFPVISGVEAGAGSVTVINRRTVR